MNTRLAVRFLALFAGAAPAVAQIDRVTTQGMPAPVGACTTSHGFAITACTDQGCAIVGGAGNCAGLNLLRTDSTGLVLWENHYSEPLSVFGGVGFGVESTIDRGFAVAGIPGNDTTYDPYRLGVFKTDSKGKVQWAWKTMADSQIDPVDYKWWECPRVRQLPDGSYVAISVKRHMLEGCGGSSQAYDTGVLFKIDASGNPVFSYEYGEGGHGFSSFIAFTDLCVNQYGIFVIGTIRNAGECDPCLQDTDALLAWFDFNGNPIIAYSFDGPHDPAPIPGGCEHPTSREWGCGLHMNGGTAFFSMTPHMAYTEAGDGYVGSFDVFAGALNWSEYVKDFYPMYHCVEQRDDGTVLVGGHWPGGSWVRSGLIGLSPSTGAVLWGRKYTDPRVIDSFHTIRGMAPLASTDKSWVLTGFAGDLYYMKVTGTGDSECSSQAVGVSAAEKVTSGVRNLEIAGSLDITQWPLGRIDANTATLDPCRH